MELIRGTIVTMNPRREIVTDGAVAVDGTTISAVGSWVDIRASYPEADVSGSPADLVLPGYINGHQHLTGDRLIQSSIPDNIVANEAIFRWSVPTHEQHTGDDDELSATFTLAESLSNGITSTFEAGTVAHPERIAAAARNLGARLTIGTWGWDVEGGPFAGTVDEVLDRQRQMLDLADPSDRDRPLVSAWVSLVGHDLMSDELVVGASQLAQEAGVGMTFHLSPSAGDAVSYLERTGSRPLVHLESLGALGPHIAIAHGVHLDDTELEVALLHDLAVVSCPWAYLRLGQGLTADFRHFDLWQRGGRLALGCDAENAGDMVDGIRTAALFAGLAKDTNQDPTLFGAHDALELLTIKGAAALGIDDLVGSLEVGKQADIVIHDRSKLEWIPNSPDPVLQLIWGSDGRSVRDVYVAGKQVVADKEILGADIDALTHDAVESGRSLRVRAGLPAQSHWPVL
ncbi:MAG: 5-methylthioadenosine/S-adenosylhomocysteine deaminase [Verrucomicrobiales bacterium]|jgi:5-methylthioadenosine/S-adenosylhomocysteine deaminase